MSATPQNTRYVADARAIVERLNRAGFVAYWAGGCVRDYLLGREFKDIDIATNAPPDEVLRLFPQGRTIGKSFGVILLCGERGANYEIATFRREGPYSDGRRPDTVAFTTAEEDAQRRDFTVNALFYDPTEDRVYDFVNGCRDLADRVLRTVGAPEDRFAEDYLRMLRAVRFSSVLEFDLAPATAEGIRTLAHRITRISAERIQQEVTRLLLESPRAGAGVRLLHHTGLLAHILPEAEAMVGVQQPPEFHPEGDVFTHTCLMLDYMETDNPILAYAVLLHDVGKPPTASLDVNEDGSERIRFNGHDQVGAGLAEEILTRWRCSNEWISSVSQCVARHMRFIHIREMRNAKRRRWMADPLFPVELELHRLDSLASHGDLGTYEFVKEAIRKMENEPTLPPRWISGHDLIRWGVPKGPEVGRWLKWAYDQQLDGAVADAEALREQIQHRLSEDQSS